MPVNIGDVQVSIFTISGKLLKKMTLFSQKSVVTTEFLQPGVYLIRAENTKNSTTETIIKLP